MSMRAPMKRPVAATASLALVGFVTRSSSVGLFGSVTSKSPQAPTSRAPASEPAAMRRRVRVPHGQNPTVTLKEKLREGG